MPTPQTDADPATATPSKTRSLRGIILTFLGAACLAGGGFYTAFTGVIPTSIPTAGTQASDIAPVGFVAIDPLMISLAPDASARYLRFGAQLEIDPASRAEVTRLTPRIIDVLTTYLRAVDPADLAEPATMTRLRAQMLRRVRIVTGDDRVRDLLITEFVLS